MGTGKISLHEWLILMVNIGKYTVRPMDASHHQDATATMVSRADPNESANVHESPMVL